MIFMFVLRHCRPKYFVCIFNSFSTYNCIKACRTFSVRFKIGAALNTTSIMTRECFHFVNLFRIRSRLIHENIFRHEYGAVSPITKLSDVNSGGESPIIHAGKSKIGILNKNEINDTMHTVIKFVGLQTGEQSSHELCTYTFFEPT